MGWKCKATLLSMVYTINKTNICYLYTEAAARKEGIFRIECQYRNNAAGNSAAIRGTPAKSYGDRHQKR